jgi:hypothetical protein
VLFGELLIGNESEDDAGEGDDATTGLSIDSGALTDTGKSVTDLVGSLDKRPPNAGRRVAKIDVEKATNGEDADVPTGPELNVGQPVIWTYVVRNAGNVPLFGLVVLDDKGASPFRQSGDANGNGVLDVGEAWTYAATGRAVEGQYKNIARVTARDPEGMKITDEDPSHYLGIQPLEPSEEEEEPPEPERRAKLRMGFEKKVLEDDIPPSKCGPWTFPLVDGYTVNVRQQQFSSGPITMTGTLTIILHLDEWALSEED